LKTSSWWISECFEDPCGGLFIGSQLLQDLQLVHPRLPLCNKSRDQLMILLSTYHYQLTEHQACCSEVPTLKERTRCQEIEPARTTNCLAASTRNRTRRTEGIGRGEEHLRASRTTMTRRSTAGRGQEAHPGEKSRGRSSRLLWRSSSVRVRRNPRVKR
jgi:hypothetical protein